MCWPALEDLSWSIWTSWRHYERSILSLTHLSCLIANPKLDWVISSAFAWVIASSGTWGSFELWDSCYSWWLLSPRRLGAVEELCQELVIVLGHLPVIMRGSCASPGGAPKATLVECTCHWATSLMGRLLRLSMSCMRFVLHLLGTESPNVSRHNEY
jgi:hypothetical protein